MMANGGSGGGDDNEKFPVILYSTINTAYSSSLGFTALS
jgi:hypothetical protein